jgi:hypothetical protein
MKPMNFTLATKHEQNEVLLADLYFDEETGMLGTRRYYHDNQRTSYLCESGLIYEHY